MVQPRSAPLTATKTPSAVWAKTLSCAPIVDCRVDGLVPGAVRHWRGVTPEIDQVALDQHYVSVHLGGPKRLWRRGEGAVATRDVGPGDYSVVPAGAAFQWRTIGPIDFVHFYFDPGVLDQVIAGAFDRDPGRILLEDCLGESDPLIRAMALGLLEELTAEDSQQACLDDMLHLLLCRVLRRHSNVRAAQPARHALAPYRLRRALDFVEAHLGDPIGVADIAGASGFSRYHFSRAFREATGRSPYAFLLEARIAAARHMLLTTQLSLDAIAAQCGFAGTSQLSRMFKREIGVPPQTFRNRR